MAKKKKKVVHKLKWQYWCEEHRGWQINVKVHRGFTPFCSGKPSHWITPNYGRASKYWKDVTCKKCKRMRKK
jgi:hypothetical protein